MYVCLAIMSVEEVAPPVGVVPNSQKDGRAGPGSAAEKAQDDPAEHIYKVQYPAPLEKCTHTCLICFRLKLRGICVIKGCPLITDRSLTDH